MLDHRPRTKSWHSRYHSTKGTPRTHQNEPASGVLIHGTDFRHAVEFSRSGRTDTQTLTDPRPWRLVPRYASPGTLSHPGVRTTAPRSCDPVSLGAKKKLRGQLGVVKPLRHFSHRSHQEMPCGSVSSQVTADSGLLICEPGHAHRPAKSPSTALRDRGATRCRPSTRGASRSAGRPGAHPA